MHYESRMIVVLGSNQCEREAIYMGGWEYGVFVSYGPEIIVGTKTRT
jgi:hypothetical protein